MIEALIFTVGVSVGVIGTGIVVFQRKVRGNLGFGGLKTHSSLKSRYAVVGELTSGLVHDMGNPLATIQLSLESLERVIKEKENNSLACDGYLQRAKRALQSLKNLITIVQKQIQTHNDRYSFQIRPLLEEASFLLEFRGRQQGLLINIFCEPSLCLYGNPLSFSRVVTNLLANAFDAYSFLQRVKSSNPKKISLKVEENDGMVYLTVRDWASGVKAKSFDRVFSPLQTSKLADKGTGVGLALCRSIVEAEFGGVIILDGKKGQGTTVVVTIPKQR